MSGLKSILGRGPSRSRRMAIAVLCLVGALGVSACGQKGPLYLPAPGTSGKEKPVSTPAPAVPVAPR
ncbi:LPS translocon maturation chaperone LptM [Hydrogenophaga sp.]|uniref:LPS translocon maturation chaperone LptM n=1 Tax=Hydrogenophaga sp. TaxID=1904254 RepID=UPI003F6E8A8F